VEYIDRPSLQMLRDASDLPRSAAAPSSSRPRATTSTPWEPGSAKPARSTPPGFASGAQDRERFRALRHALPELVGEPCAARASYHGHRLRRPHRAQPRHARLLSQAASRQLLPGRLRHYGHIGTLTCTSTCCRPPSPTAEIATGCCTSSPPMPSSWAEPSAEHGLGEAQSEVARASVLAGRDRRHASGQAADGSAVV